MALTTVSASQPEASRLGDFVRAIWNPGFNYVSAKVRGPVGATTANNKNKRVLGQPVKFAAGVWTFCLAAEAGLMNGMIADDGIYDTPIAGADSVDPFTILVRDPAIIGETAIPLYDIIGTGIDSNSYKSGALAQCGIVTQAALTPTKKQTN